MSYGLELAVRGKIAATRARLFMLSNAAPRQRQTLDRVIGAAFPGMPAAEAATLYARHRLSMRKFTLIKQHMAALSVDKLNDFLDRHVEVEGREHLDAVMTSAAPVIFVTPHYGNFPAGCLKLIKEIGHRKTVNAFYNPPSTNRSSEGFEDLFKRLLPFGPLVIERSQALPDFRVLVFDDLLQLRHRDGQLLDLGRLVHEVFVEQLLSGLASRVVRLQGVVLHHDLRVLLLQLVVVLHLGLEFRVGNKINRVVRDWPKTAE